MDLQTAKSVGKQLYTGAIIGSALYGAYKGLCRWWKWKSKRKLVTIKNETIDPVLNIGRDGGYMGYYVVAGGGSSALITATFPVTIPAMMYFSKEVGDEEDDADD